MSTKPDLQARLSTLEQKIGLPENENDLTPIQVINKANQEISNNISTFDKSSSKYDKLINENKEILSLVDGDGVGSSTSEGLSNITKKQGLVRLECLNSELQGIGIEDVQEQLKTLKLLEPVIDKSKESFNKLLDNQENQDPGLAKNGGEEGQNGTEATSQALLNLSLEIEKIGQQLTSMTHAYGKEVREINSQFKRLEERIIKSSSLLERELDE